MEYILIGLCLGIGFAAGIYVSSQVASWIDKKSNGKS